MTEERVVDSSSKKFIQSTWCHRALPIFLCIVAAFSSFLTVVTDCDETFGYWEPLHKLLYGYGLQTWEYHPNYAIRPYAYLLIHSLPARLLKIFFSNKIYVYRGVKLFLGLFSFFCHYQFCSVVAFRFSPRVARLTLLLLTLTPGMMQASTALLPNSQGMNLVTLIWTYYLWGADNRVAMLTILMVILTWPYAIVAVLIPIVTTMRETIMGKNRKASPAAQISFSKWVEILFRRWFIAGIFGFCYILIPTVIIDRIYYGRWLVSNLNAIVYNLFTTAGPTLFGIEPPSFLLKNLLLNFNVFFPIAALYPLLGGAGGQTCVVGRRIWVTCFGVITLFSMQAHKEERFLYPIYPLLMTLSAVSLDNLLRKRRMIRSLGIMMTFMGLILGFSRSIALFRNYHSPMYTLSQLKPSTLDKGQETLLCMADEWHRFPSHFAISGGSTRLAFIRIGFEGILPQYFKSSTASLDNVFNSQNKGVDGQFTKLDQCDYYLITNKEASKLGVSIDTILLCGRIVDSTITGASIFRWLYIPFLEPTMQPFCLLKAQ